MSTLLEKIRNAQQETKDFPYKIGDEEFSITVTAIQAGDGNAVAKNGDDKTLQGCEG